MRLIKDYVFQNKILVLHGVKYVRIICFCRWVPRYLLSITEADMLFVLLCSPFDLRFVQKSESKIQRYHLHQIHTPADQM